MAWDASHHSIGSVYHVAVMDANVLCAAFVLAGGQSSRMGMDKARLKLPSGETLIERTLRVCSEAVPDVVLVAPRDRYSDLRWTGTVLEDRLSGRGPLGGIQTALTAGKADLSLVVAVDMPDLSSELLRFLLIRAAQSEALATVPFAGGKLQTLCAVFRRGFLPFADAALREGMNKIRPALDAAGFCTIEERELTEAGFAPDLFRNINTPDDYARLVPAAGSQ